MNVHFKILDVQTGERDNHIMIVRYTTDILTEEVLNVNPSEDGFNEDGSVRHCKLDVALNIPIPEPSAEELEKYIFMSAPIYALKRFEEIQSNEVVTSASNVTSMMTSSFTKTEDDIIQIARSKEADSVTLSREEFEAIINDLSANT